MDRLAADTPRFTCVEPDHSTVLPFTIRLPSQEPSKLKKPPLVASWQPNMGAATLTFVLWTQPFGGSSKLNSAASATVPRTAV